MNNKIVVGECKGSNVIFDISIGRIVKNGRWLTPDFNPYYGTLVVSMNDKLTPMWEIWEEVFKETGLFREQKLYTVLGYQLTYRNKCLSLNGKQAAYDTIKGYYWDTPKGYILLTEVLDEIMTKTPQKPSQYVIIQKNGRDLSIKGNQFFDDLEEAKKQVVFLMGISREENLSYYIAKVTHTPKFNIEWGEDE